MPYTATITNVAPRGTSLVVFFRVDPLGEDRMLAFESDVTRPTVRQAIKAQLDELNLAETRSANLQDLIGTVLS